MNQPIVYNYTDPRQFLLDSFGLEKSKKDGVTLRSWSEDLGFASHSTLVRVLQGKRAIKAQHVPPICKGLQLQPEEQLYFQTLVQLKNSRTISEKKYYEGLLKQLNPHHRLPHFEEIENFQLISKWVHSAILSMTHLENFESSPRKIQKKLRNRVPAHEIESAVDRLKKLGLLKRENGSWVAKNKNTTSKNDIPSEGVKAYHKAILEIASNSLDVDPVENREFQSYSIAINRNKVDIAKKMIRRFVNRLVRVVTEDSLKDEVYQLSVNFFPITGAPADLKKKSKNREVR